MSEPMCRMKRMAAGLSYPKSSCQKCGTLIRANFRCAEDMHDDTRARQAAAGPDVVARLREGADLMGQGHAVFMPYVMLEAAAAIEARDAEIARLREALDRLEMHAIQDARHWYSVPAGEWEQVFLAALAPPPASDAPAPAGWDEGTCNR